MHNTNRQIYITLYIKRLILIQYSYTTQCARYPVAVSATVARADATGNVAAVYELVLFIKILYLVLTCAVCAVYAVSTCAVDVCC